MDYIIIIAIMAAFIATLVARNRANEKKKIRAIEEARALQLQQERLHRLQQIERAAADAKIQYQRMIDAKTASTKIKHAQYALDTMRTVEGHPELHDVIKNYDEMAQHLEAITRVAPVITAVEKSYRHKFKGSQKPELNALLDALYEIKKNSVTNQDIVSARLMPSGTGEIIEIENIERRCRELGWNG